MRVDVLDSGSRHWISCTGSVHRLGVEFESGIHLRQGIGKLCRVGETQNGGSRLESSRRAVKNWPFSVFCLQEDKNDRVGKSQVRLKIGYQVGIAECSLVLSLCIKNVHGSPPSQSGFRAGSALRVGANRVLHALAQMCPPYAGAPLIPVGSNCRGSTGPGPARATHAGAQTIFRSCTWVDSQREVDDCIAVAWVVGFFSQNPSTPQLVTSLCTQHVCLAVIPQPAGAEPDARR